MYMAQAVLCKNVHGPYVVGEYSGTGELEFVDERCTDENSRLARRLFYFTGILLLMRRKGDGIRQLKADYRFRGECNVAVKKAVRRNKLALDRNAEGVQRLE